uniref:Uncharacterized protein n=1 Tax=Odontella aurita TaxID=265563 RepID=A0A6U6EJC1_9STRA|mmetsp:Transcript_27242/g.80312  ORF Transcript_27242/g.80312 Transcript_27242/m.80312 type:complete len:106 (+) Transcript_27242:98-415(+)
MLVAISDLTDNVPLSFYTFVLCAFELLGPSLLHIKEGGLRCSSSKQRHVKAPGYARSLTTTATMDLPPGKTYMHMPRLVVTNTIGRKDSHVCPRQKLSMGIAPCD